jgi:hypothetical protein
MGETIEIAQCEANAVAWREQLPRVCWNPFKQNVCIRASDLAETCSTVQTGRTVRVQRSQLNGDATFLCVLHHLPQQHGADAAVLELGQQHEFAQLDEVRTVLHAYIADRYTVAFNNLMNRRIPTIPKIRVLGSHVPRAELAFNNIPIGLMVRIAPEFGISWRS